MPEARARLPRTVKALAVVSLMNDFASEMVYPLLPAFVTRTLGGGAAILGALDGAADLASAALRWVSGRWADRPGWRGPLILVGYGLAVLVRPLMGFASAAWQVVAFRVVDRVGKGLRSPARDAMIADVTPTELRGRAFGFHRGADHLGAVLGSLAAWWLLTRQVDVRRVLSWSAVPGLVAALALVWALRSAARRDSAPPAPTLTNESDRVPWASLIGLATLGFVRLPETLLLLRMQDLGLAMAAVPLIWAVLHIVRSVASYPGGVLVDRFGVGGSLAAGTLVYAGALAALSRPLAPAVAVSAYLAYGLVAGLIEPAERAAVVAMAGPKKGRAFGIYQGIAGAAALPVGLAFGWLYQSRGAGLALVAGAGASVAALGVWAAGRKTVRR